MTGPGQKALVSLSSTSRLSLKVTVGTCAGLCWVLVELGRPLLSQELAAALAGPFFLTSRGGSELGLRTNVLGLVK